MIKDSPWNSFNLNPLLIKCLLENGYTKPTDIQAHSLPYHQYKTDLILASKTVFDILFKVTKISKIYIGIRQNIMLWNSSFVRLDE